VKSGSLRLRLLAAGAASILVALALAGLGLTLLFERHVERRVLVELELDLRQLIGHLGRGENGALLLERPLADPRFDVPLSGLYWQITEEPGGVLLRSRSLWDGTLDLPTDRLRTGEVHHHTIAGPGGATVLILERHIALPQRLGGSAVRAAVAIDRGEIHAAGRAFASELAPSLAVLAAVLIAAAWVQVTVGLRPLDAIRRRLAAIRTGAAARLGTDFPDEVQPLAAEVDGLLDTQDATIERARAHAADLAHGLKTPLTVLADDARQLRTRGEAELADEIAALVDGMRRHIERELARARAGVRARGGASQRVSPIAAQVVEVMRRTPRGKELGWQIDIPGDVAVGIDAQDLAEMLGNLVENAAQWARTSVRLSGWHDSDASGLLVEDDGPGVPDHEVATVLARGGRLDATKSGAGLGLAIVGDLVEAYGGSLALKRSPLGGLRAEIRLPGRRPKDGLETPARAFHP
jgi:signal transduction histidine kinase